MVNGIGEGGFGLKSLSSRFINMYVNSVILKN